MVLVRLLTPTSLLDSSLSTMFVYAKTIFYDSEVMWGVFGDIYGVCC